MAGTNAVKFKKALIDQIATSLAANQATAAVQVSYHYPGNDAERDLVHGGRVEGPQRYPVSGAGSVRYKRHEILTVKVHIVVHKHGSDPYEAEARCAEIGTVIEELIAANPIFAAASLGGQMIQAAVTAMDLDSDSYDDGNSVGVLTYDIECESRLN